MKTTVKILLITGFLFVNSSFAQGLKIGFGGGLTTIQSPDSYTASSSSGGSGFSTEYHLGLKVKVEIPLMPFIPAGFINYHILNGSENTPTGRIETSQTILAIGAGVEFSFIPGPLSPYFALDLSVNNFSDLDIEVPQTSGESRTISGFSRFGIGIGIGLELSLLPVDVDVSAKYSFLNLAGKQSDEETISIFSLNLTLFF